MPQGWIEGAALTAATQEEGRSGRAWRWVEAVLRPGAASLSSAPLAPAPAASTPPPTSAIRLHPPSSPCLTPSAACSTVSRAARAACPPAGTPLVCEIFLTWLRLRAFRAGRRSDASARCSLSQLLACVTTATAQDSTSASTSTRPPEFIAIMSSLVATADQVWTSDEIEVSGSGV